MRPSLIIIAGFTVSSILCGSAWAQANRTFVSGHGSDSNPCTLADPCRTFAQAITQTNAGGEIAVLDTAGYGAVTITKSVSIVNEGGVEAGITVATATDGIDINIGFGDVVNLRGLTLTGGGVGKSGIAFTNLGAVNIQNCVIRGFLGGIAFLPTGTAALNVSDTIVSNNGSIGAEAQPASGSSGAVTAVFNRVQAIDDNAGFFANGVNSTGALNITIANSVATNNRFAGIAAQSGAGATLTQLMVANSVVSNNATGVVDGGANSTTYLATDTISGNAQTFFVNNAGTLFSFGDNDIKGNGDDATSPTISLVSKK